MGKMTRIGNWFLVIIAIVHYIVIGAVLIHFVIFTEWVSGAYLGFLNIHIMCTDGDKISLLGGGAHSLIYMSVSV